MGETKREMLGSRLGFLLVSAGCAIGLGNIWRFPFITGEYGGAWFLLIFVFCQLAVMPVLMVEFAMGRASRRNLGLALRVLQPRGTQWYRMGPISYVGCSLLLMFYVVISGWMLYYCGHMIGGTFAGMPPAGVGAFFDSLLLDAGVQVGCMTAVVLFGALVCFAGLQNGVERVVKVLMIGLFLILLVLVAHSFTLPGAAQGLHFYLMPDADKIGRTGFLPICSAALSQAFFTLSVGIGSMCVFGSYMHDDRSIVGETALVTGMDFLVALLSGFIIFPACFTFGVAPSSGPGLVFVTLPNIFASMAGGRLWGSLFFVFMSCAAMTTVVAIFENLVNYLMDRFAFSRRRSVVVNAIALWFLALPCALGFNILSSFRPFGEGSSVLDLEDFLLSNNLLPFGAFMLILFCTLRCGWGWENFAAEANRGAGLRLPGALRFYLRWVLPAIIVVLFVAGYVDKFAK